MTYSHDVRLPHGTYTGIIRKSADEARQDMADYLQGFTDCKKAGLGSDWVTVAVPTHDGWKVFHTFITIYANRKQI